MKPEEKAEELVNKYIDRLEDVGTVPEDVRRNAISCSLLCVEECLDTLDVNIMDLQKCTHARKYWHKVKHELSLF